MTRRLKRLVPGLAVCLALALVAQRLAGMPLLRVLGPLTLALVFGMMVRAAAGLPASVEPGSKFAARPVLRAGVFLMGARLDLGLVARVGPRIVALDVVLICLGLCGIPWLASKLRVPASLSVLLAVGTSICGASAVVAAGSVTRADEEDVSLAVALCGVLGTVGAIFYVLAGPHLHTTLPVLAGSTLHEVAQVVAAGSGELGMLVKLTRVVLLAPALLVLGALAGRGERPKYSLREPPVPWFVIGFIALGLAAHFLPRPWTQALGATSVFLMAVAMAAMGLHVPFAMLRKAGARVLYAGALAFACMALVSAGLIHALGISG